MRALVGPLIAATLASCTPAPIVTPTEAPTSPPVATATPLLVQPYTLSPALHLGDDPFRIPATYRANADETLTFRLEFFADMDTASVEDAIRSHAPSATNFRWPLDLRSVEFDVPPGSASVVIDPSGARSTSVRGTVVGRWLIERPASDLALYRPEDIAAGRITPQWRRSLPFQTGGGLLIFDPGMKTALVAVRSLRPTTSFVDLGTGTRSAVPGEIGRISSDGAMLTWLPDGRFLTLGTHDTIVSGPRGDDMRRLPTAQPGQSGRVSPAGHEVALWSYTKNDLSVLDLDGGRLRPLAAGFRRCSGYFNASLSWSPDGRTIAVGHCTEDLGGVAATAFIDAASGRRVGTLWGYTIAAWLPDGRLLGRTWGPPDGGVRRADPGLAVFDATGERIGSLDVEYYASVSPDGRWLLDIDSDVHDPEVRLIDTRSGRVYPFLEENAYPSWTPDGRIAIVRSAPTQP